MIRAVQGMKHKSGISHMEFCVFVLKKVLKRKADYFSSLPPTTSCSGCPVYLSQAYYHSEINLFLAPVKIPIL